MPAENPILVALDVPTPTQAIDLARQVAPYVGGFKVGLELFTSGGSEVVAAIRELGSEVFLDLKFHDIPNTVAKAVANATRLKVQWMTIHCAGGPDMIQAAVASARENAAALGIHPPVILGVTVLTSMDQAQLKAIGVGNDVEDQVAALASMAVSAGLEGLVCSPLELERLRRNLPKTIALVTPGIRAATDALGDQKRVMGPQEAVAGGATRLVMGRPIYAASDPALAAKTIAQGLGVA